MFGIKKLRKEFYHLEARYNEATDYLFGCKSKLMDDVRKNQKDILALKKEKEEEKEIEETYVVAKRLFNNIRVKAMDVHVPRGEIVNFALTELTEFFSKNANRDKLTPEFWDKVLEEIEKL